MRQNRSLLFRRGPGLLMVLLAGWILSAELASAQRARPPSARSRATRALERLDLSRCVERAEWAARSVQVGLVVFPDGGYGVALGTVAPPLDREGRAALGGCIEAAVRLTDPVPDAPRTAFVVTRALELPGSDEVVVAVAPLLDASRASFEDCVRQHAPPSLRRIEVVARVEVREGHVTEVRSREPDPRDDIARCVQRAVREATGLPDGAGVVRASVMRPQAPPGVLPRTDGTQGAVCSWGESEVEDVRGRYVLPEPRPCRPGLQCCAGGGAAGSNATCSRAGRGCGRRP